VSIQRRAARRKGAATINVTIPTHTARISASLLAIGVLACLVQPGLAQRYHANANPDSPEGRFLDLIELQSDGARRLALIEQFPQRFPGHPAVSWAYEQLQIAAMQASDWDKALAFGERLAQINPDDMEVAQLNIKAAESKGDRTTGKLWTDYLSRIVQRTLESPPPKDPELIEKWKKQTAYAAQLAAQDEYALYKKALDSADPREQIKLLDDLLKQNSDTTYLPQALVIYLNAYRALGDSDNAMRIAEKIVKSDPSNEDALLTVTEGYLRRGAASDKVLAYSARLIGLMPTKKKPAVVRQEDWEKKKAYYIGTAHWMMGNIYINQKRFGLADSALRAALPLLPQNHPSYGSILFYLGWSNYKLEHYVEAVRFFKRCMAIPGQFQELAIKNLSAIRNEQGIQD
jgi:tetratricopeptide (TPR) repeat protein